MSIMLGGPAARDGRLRPGDRIEAVAQGSGPFESSAGLALERVLPKIRGPKGSVVRLRVSRDGADGAPRFVVALSRDEVRLTDPDACPAPRAGVRGHLPRRAAAARRDRRPLWRARCWPVRRCCARSS